MRLGILTLHSQLNYGGVLQAFALCQALNRQGYDTGTVDRWTTPSNVALRGPWSIGDVKASIEEALRTLLCLGDGTRMIRRRRTRRFIKRWLRLTKEHFIEWAEPAAQMLSVDCLVVGSDQVWNGDWNRADIYLLKGAPERLSVVAYAASFGMKAIPAGMEELYRKGFKRFSAISVREVEGVKLVEAMGALATHVVDPTLLLEPSVWQASVSGKKHRRPLLTVYVLSEDVEALSPKLRAFARRHHAKVRLLVDSGQRPFPRTPKQLLLHFRWLMRRLFSPVKPFLTAGPQEFLEAFAQADWVLSDSFHALMFSSIFDKQVAILRPKSEKRKGMFARIEEFVETTTDGPVIEDTVESALARFERGERMSFRQDVIAKRREASWAWLRAALDKVERERAEWKD